MTRLLVVDDDALVARTLEELLSFHGYSAVRAGSGEEALDALAREPVDLVILDLRLPGIGGVETCTRIRERYGPSLPIIMLTAFGEPAAVRQGYEAGADDLLHKPVDTTALILKVRAFLRLKSLHDEIQRSREEAQARARDFALLHEIGRDWSLIAEPEDFHRMVTERLAGLIGAPICMVGLYDPHTRTIAAALPVHGVPDDVARQLRYVVKPEYRSSWNFRSGRPYLSNRAATDPRLVPEMVRLVKAESIVLVPMLSEGVVLGLLVAVNKPGGFSDDDAQLMSIFAGPAATFLRSRQIFDRQRRHAARLERLSGLAGAMAAATGRAALLELTVTRIQKDLGYERVAFYAPDESGAIRLEHQAGAERPAGVEQDLVRWALRGTTPLRGSPAGAWELAIPVRAGEEPLGVLDVLRLGPAPFEEDEVNLLFTLAGPLAVALKRAASVEETERLARQMGTLYDVGLETSALRDLRQLFVKAAEEAGRLIKADHASVFRLDEGEGLLRLYAAWTRDPAREPYSQSVFRLGEGIAGRVARDWVPALVNDAESNPKVVPRANPLARIICVPLTYYDRDREATTLFGVLNATRRPGAPRFTGDDLEYLTRFAGQLSIAVANTMAFTAERERSEQLALVNTLIREIAGNLSRERIFETAVRRIREAFQYPVVTIGVPDYSAGRHTITAGAWRQPPSGEWGSYPLYAGIAGRAFREKRTILVHDVLHDPDYVKLFPSTRSEVAIPILSGDEVVAVLNVESDVPRAFSRRGEVITLETLADGIGIILRNAELYHALERLNARLVELDRLKSEVVNIVAHDFRAPLAGILGYAELLEWKPDAPPEERVEHARAIIQAATHMASLVDKTLKTTRLETGHFPFEFGVVDVGATVRTVLKRLPEDPRHPVEAEIPDDPLPGWADRERLAEVLENLLSNAVKYSPGGGPIRVEARRDGESVTVLVRDRGIGIAPEDLDRLFRPFSRLRTPATADIGGSGLGLYICERIVRAHGGRLWVESVPGEGSTFSFSLPFFGAAAQAARALLLVAAADEATRREVRKVAEDLGYGLHEVADGLEAVEAALRLRPQAVILDRILPKLRADEVVERLRENRATASIPVFALAHPAEIEGEAATLFRGFVPKPLNRNVLAAALEILAPRVP